MGVRAPGPGGPRKGAGRPPSLPEEVRRNRLVITLTDGEVAKLRKLAAERDLPLGTAAHEFVARALRRR